jgi:Leucine-rich repeat (LRR) protein
LNINLANNAITEVPDSINGLRELQILDLSSNQITQLPDMSGMVSLADINLAGNHLTEFPSFSPDALKKINLVDNAIDNLNGIENLEKLESLLISDNPLSIVPTGLSDLGELINVDLQNTKLRKINRLYSGRFAVKDLQSYLSKLKESDETHTCNFCGHTQAIALIVCEQCEHQFAHCFICKKGFVDTIRANCTECGEQFHDDHIRRVLKLTSKCPNCKSANSIIL